MGTSIVWGVGIFLYLVAAWAALTWVTAPLALICVGVGALAGVVTALVLTGWVFMGGDPAVRVMLPAQVADGAVGGRKHPHLPRRDTAWAAYFAGPVVRDVCGVWNAVVRVTIRVWRFFWREELRTIYLALFPFTLPGALGLAVFTLGGAAVALAVTVVAMGVTAVLWVLGGALTWAMRGGDRAYQWVFRSKTGCPHEDCWYVNPLPAYRCHGCGEVHRDLRPGRLGVLWHVCECGRRLPTTRLRAGHRLRPVCQRCLRDLALGAGRHTDVRVPVFGATSSGKSRFIMAAFGSLHLAAGDAVEAADIDSDRALRDYDRDLTADLGTAATAVVPPKAVTVRLRLPGRRLNGACLIHVFDAAGEYSQNREINEELSYLDHARTLVFVLDPFAVRSVGDQAGGELLGRANRSLHDPEDSYAVTVQRLQAYRVKTHERSLAVVVSKADLLARMPLAAGLHAGGVRDWLAGQGLGNLVRMAEGDFRSVRYFLVSSRKGAYGSAVDALVPLRWLLAEDGVELP